MVSFQLLLCVREILKSNELNTFMLCDICRIIYQTKVSLILLWNSEIHFYECQYLLYARYCKLYLHIVKLRRILSFYTLVRGNKDDLKNITSIFYINTKRKYTPSSSFYGFWIKKKETNTDSLYINNLTSICGCVCDNHIDKELALQKHASLSTFQIQSFKGICQFPINLEPR